MASYVPHTYTFSRAYRVAEQQLSLDLQMASGCFPYQDQELSGP